MARIFNFMADWAGSGKYRAILPSIELAQLGHEVMCSVRLDAKHKDGYTFAAQSDVWIGHRPDGADISNIIQKLAASPRTALMVIDLDDNAWDIHPSNSAFSLGFPDRLAANMRAVDMVTVCSYGLAEVVASRGNVNPSKIRVVPNFVPDVVLDFDREPRKDLPKFVYGGSASHLIDIGIIKEAFVGLDRDFEIRLLGNSFDLGVDPALVEYGEWTENLEDYYRLIDGDVGLAPLADDPFNYGKSDLKVLEYMARGIPFVASNRGPYAEISSSLNGKAGFFVDGKDEWVDALRLLVDARDLAAEMGACGQEWIRNNRTSSLGALFREDLYGIGPKRTSGVYAEVRK